MFRLAVAEDFETLRHIYSHTVKKIAPSLYSSSQVIAWSSAPDNINKFHNFIFNADTYLSIENEQIIGFCGLENDGHIASFYFHPDFTRQGYGTKLLLYVLEIGIKKGIIRFYTEASFFSQPVFARCGFNILTMETVNYGDISFERYKMELITQQKKNS